MEPSNQPAPAAPAPAGKPKEPLVIIGGAVLLVAVIGGVLWWKYPRKPEEQTKPPDRTVASKKYIEPPEAVEKIEQAPKKKPGGNGNSFLEDFGKDPTSEVETGTVLSNDELERRFQAIVHDREAHDAYVAKIRSWKSPVEKAKLKEAELEMQRMTSALEKQYDSLDKELGKARKARPNDVIPSWLTGELLIEIGSEPETILLHLEKALKGGLVRSRLYASMARALIETNRFEKAHDVSLQSLEKDPQDRYVWKAYQLTTFNLERFAEFAKKLDSTFPKEKPEWVQRMAKQVDEMNAKWQAEEKLRATEKKADDLPRVRITVQHRRFLRGPDGASLGKIETTGTEEFIVELFEDQAPATVANFISLVESKAYDGTRFHLAVSAVMAVGGDLQSKKGDPADDGDGGPGYVIPDEFGSPKARCHFRGSLSMVNFERPKTAGSQFFITLVPRPEFDGRHTVFGRVIRGMEAVDNITRGRTNTSIGFFGLLVPGDLLLRAEVLRKRDHEYRVIKEKAE